MASRKAPHRPVAAPRSSGWTAAAICAILVAVAAAYSNSFSGPFIFDDARNIQGNESIRHLFSTAVLFPPGQRGIVQRPLTNLSFAVNYAISGLNVQSYHAVNLLIHLLAALTLFGIVRRTLLLPALRDRFGPAATGLATAVALIWALHPLQTESVTYIVQRAESLMGLCFLLTLYCLIRAATADRTDPSYPSYRSYWTYACVAVCALGMGAKEVMATAPVVALLYDRVFLSGSFRETFRRRWRLYLGLAATWGLLAAIWLGANINSGPVAAGFGLKTVTPWHYALTQPGVILHYLALSFWPASLCLDYGWPFATKLWVWPVAPQAFALAALLAATVWALIRRPALGFLGAWFFLILGPTSSFMPIEDACYEHRMYLSLAAVVAGVVFAARALIRRLARGSARPDQTAMIAAVALTLAASVALGGLTYRRNEDYHTEISFWEDMCRKRPDNARGWSNLAACYLMDDRFEAAGYDRTVELKAAIRCYDRAVELKHPDALYNRAVAWAKKQDHDRAIGDFPAMKQDRDHIISDCTGFIDSHKDSAGAPAGEGPNLAEACRLRGGAYFENQRYLDALQDCTHAISLSPDSAMLYFNRANIYGALRRYDLALPDLDRAIELNPGYPLAWKIRSRTYFNLKDYDHAWRDLATFRKLGGQPDPAFLQALMQASGRSE